LAVIQNLTLLGYNDPGKTAQESSFACSIWAEDGNNLPLGDVEGNVIEDIDSSVPFAE